MKEIVPGASGAFGELGEQLDHRPERALERRPVLEVERAPQLLAGPRGQASPGARADRLVPGLELVDPGRHEHGQGARDDQVVVGAARVLDDPVPLLGVDHVAAALGEHARRARVDHDQPRAPEVAVEREAARRRLAVDGVRELAQARAAVLVAAEISASRRSSASSGGARLPRCW